MHMQIMHQVMAPKFPCFVGHPYPLISPLVVLVREGVVRPPHLMMKTPTLSMLTPCPFQYINYLFHLHLKRKTMLGPRLHTNFVSFMGALNN